jgi:8-oxo-dGTP pyrophosphatase MutT (NUDIX family)
MNEPIKYHAAGGVVIRENGRMLLLLEVAGRKELRLPKGHIEDGETVEQAAVREVQEETGYADVEIIDDLGSVTHTFTTSAKTPTSRAPSRTLMRLNSEQPYHGAV